MFADLTDIIKIPAAILAGALLTFLVMISYYEGLSLPLVGQLINGRVANAADAAREGYVVLAEKTAADATAAEMTRQRNAASLALSEAEKRAAAANIADQATQAQTDLDVSEYEKKLSAANRRCLVDPADIEFLRAH